MTAPYHEQFWVVAGTAAPVIALAAVVTAGDVFRARTWWLPIKPKSAEPRIAGLNALVYLMYLATLGIAFINLTFFQIGLMNAAMTSLIAGHDSKPPASETSLVTTGFVLLLAAVFTRGVAHVAAAIAEGTGHENNSEDTADDARQEPDET